MNDTYEVYASFRRKGIDNGVTIEVFFETNIPESDVEQEVERRLKEAGFSLEELEEVEQ